MRRIRGYEWRWGKELYISRVLYWVAMGLNMHILDYYSIWKYVYYKRTAPGPVRH